MNQAMQDFARAQLKANLAFCTPEQHHIFRRMYSHKDLQKPINDVVDAMPPEKLDWAMTQVQRTVEDNQRPPK